LSNNNAQTLCRATNEVWNNVFCYQALFFNVTGDVSAAVWRYGRRPITGTTRFGLVFEEAAEAESWLRRLANVCRRKRGLVSVDLLCNFSRDRGF
jgi:hypothetical protein